MSYDNNRRNGGGRGSDSRDGRSQPSGRGSDRRPPQRGGQGGRYASNPPPSQNRRSSPDNRSSSSRRMGDTGEIDRYNYVDRDIYSTSKRGDSHLSRSSHTPPPKKKRSKTKVIVIVVVCIVLAIVLAIVGFVAVMLSRVNRKEVDTTSYVQTPSDAPAWDVMTSDGVMNILLIGADKDEDGSNGRSDSMMLISIDSKHKTLKMVSFLRDLYLEIPTHGKDKLNVSYGLGGAGLTMQTLENNFRINIDRYVETNFENFADMIDLMGGIEVEINQAEADYMNEIKGTHMSAGKNHMRGTLALYYARMRYLDSDFGRTGRQRQVIMCMMDKLKQLNVLETTGFLYNYLPYVTTNLTNGELTSLATKALEISKYKTETLYMPYKGTYEDVQKNVGEVLVPDLEANCQKLREFLYPDQVSSGVTSRSLKE